LPPFSLAHAIAAALPRQTGHNPPPYTEPGTNPTLAISWKKASKLLENREQEQEPLGVDRARVLCVREKCGARQRSVTELGHLGLKREVYTLRPSNRAIIEVSNESSIFFAPQISAKTTLGHGARASGFQNERPTFLAPRVDPSSKSQMSAQLPSPLKSPQRQHSVTALGHPGSKTRGRFYEPLDSTPPRGLKLALNCLRSFPISARTKAQ